MNWDHGLKKQYCLMDGHVLKIVLGPTMDENVEVILCTGKSHRDITEPKKGGIKLN